VKRERQIELLAIPRPELGKRIEEERRTRNFGVGELRDSFGEDWTTAASRISAEFDEAIDALLLRDDNLEQLRSKLRKIRDLAATAKGEEELAAVLTLAGDIEAEADEALAGE
jgi:hypothetical protein